MNDKRVREAVSPKRIPLREQSKSILTVPAKPGFVRRWVNDDTRNQGVRIEAFIRAGWRVAEDAVSVGTTGVVNQNTSLGSGARKYAGAGVNIVLMEIEERYYDEDQAAKMADVARTERAIHQGEGIDNKIGSIEIEDRYLLNK